MKKRALHIVYVIYGDLVQVVGNSIHAVEITKALVRQGHSVTFLVPKFSALKEEVGANVVTVPTLFKGALGSLIFGALVPIYLLLLSKRYPFDLVYTMQMSFVITPLIYCLVMKVPHVIELHSILLNELKFRKTNPIKDFLKKRIVQWTERVYCLYSCLIVAVSEHIVHFISTTYRVPETRIALIPNGVDVHIYQIMDKSTCRKELDIPVDAIIVGYVGTFYGYHCMERIVDIAISFLSKCPNTYFVMVGDGPRLPIIKHLLEKAGLSDKFLFTGTVPAPLCAKYINTFDVGICLHDPNYGGFPMKLLNYLACGKPVVSTRSPGTEYIAEHHLGVLVDSEDPEEIALAILHAIAMNDGDFVQRARERVVQSYSWDAKARELATHLQKIILKSCKEVNSSDDPERF